MNSHISLSRKCLMRFSSSSGRIHYLDVNGRSVEQAFARSFNTKPDYYDKETEDLLSRKAEQKMGRIYQLIERFHRQELTKVTIDHEFQEFAKDMIAIQIIRNPDFLRKNILPLIPHEQRYGARYMANQILKDEDFKHNRDEFVDLGGYVAMFMLNNTDVRFLLPSMHFYTVPYKEKKSFILVLSPKESIALIDGQVFRQYYMDSSGYYYPTIADEKTLHEMNWRSILFDIKYGSGKIVGDQDYLNQIGVKMGLLSRAKTGQ